MQITDLFKPLNAQINQLFVEPIIENNTNTIFVICKDNNDIIGTASMAFYKVISEHKGMNKDVP